ncbi:MAG TPA: BrnT family toxin [Bradyrhizobium sp.]|nr:BrnT family toxin [Bradyrhizobium sp.]
MYFRAIDEVGFWGYKNIVSIAFNPDKEARNIRKHGISRARAEEMDMAAAIVHEDDRFDYGETRYVAFGEIDDTLHCLIFTFRGSNVRAISLRKANRRENRRYGQKTEI